MVAKQFSLRASKQKLPGYPVKPPLGSAKVTKRATGPDGFAQTDTGTASKHLILEMYNANPVKLNDEQVRYVQVQVMNDKPL